MNVLGSVAGGVMYILAFALSVYVSFQVASMVPQPAREFEMIYTALILFVILASQWLIYYGLHLLSKEKKTINPVGI
jgi:hypothetical protein